MAVYKIATIKGDGIGPEVIDQGIRVVDKLCELYGFQVEWVHLDWSSKRYKSTGEYMPPDGIESLKQYDAVYFGAVGDRDIPDHISLWNLILPIRQSLQLYANIRPLKVFRGIDPPINAGPEDLDWVIVRENSEGEYAGQGGRSHVGQPYEISTEVAVFTRVACERIIRLAFRIAESRPRRLLTLVTKSNAQRFGLVMWDEIAKQVSAEFPNVKWDKMLVDAMTCRMVLQPASLDVIVATNLHADILSDLGAALSGSIGIAPSSNIDPEKKPGMFEPVHGSAFDLVGKDLANPVASFWAAAEMLRFLGEEGAADRILETIGRLSEAKQFTRDLGGVLGTREYTDKFLSSM